MTEKFNIEWRFTVAFLLLFAMIAAALVAPATVKAIIPPDTYIDPIPEYFNDFPHVTGTSIAGADRQVVDVDIQIIRHPDMKYWDDTSGNWVADPDTWNSITDLGGAMGAPWGDNQYNWDYSAVTTIVAGDLADGKTYTVKARAKDDDGYVDTGPAERNFRYDETDPDVSITTNIPATLNELTKVQGQALDTSPGQLDQVLVSIYIDADINLAYTAGEDCWNGSGWEVAPAQQLWSKATGTTSWQISNSTTPRLPDWTNGVDYAIDVKAWDKASNESYVITKPFLFRKELAEGASYVDPIAAHSSDPYINALTAITGTSRAKTGSDIDEVKVKITWKDTPDKYWDGAAWQTTLDWPDCPDATLAGAAVDGHWDWDYTPGITWEYGEDYEVQAGAHDTPNDQYYISNTEQFTFDDQKPDTEIGLITSTVYNTLDEIDGAAWDNYPGKTGSVLLTIQRDSDNWYWNGSFWQAAQEWIHANVTGSTGTVPWEITRTTSPKLPEWYNGVNYEITAESVDKAGNRDTTAHKDFDFKYQLSLLPDDPTISRSPASFTFTAVEGGANPIDQTLSIWNSGGGTLNWVVSESVDWLSLDPTSGDSLGETDNVDVSVDITGRAVGTYNTTIEISATMATNTPVFVPVELTLTEAAVGGTTLPTDKLGLMMPWIMAGILIVVAGVALAIWNRKRGAQRVR